LEFPASLISALLLCGNETEWLPKVFTRFKSAECPTAEKLQSNEEFLKTYFREKLIASNQGEIMRYEKRVSINALS
jgi:hypothetical protein